MSPVAPMLSHKRTRMLRRPISCACSFLRTGAAAASLPYLGRERRCIPDGRCECLAEVMSIQATTKAKLFKAGNLRMPNAHAIIAIKISLLNKAAGMVQWLAFA